MGNLSSEVVFVPDNGMGIYVGGYDWRSLVNVKVSCRTCDEADWAELLRGGSRLPCKQRQVSNERCRCRCQTLSLLPSG
jgi:hypothetical protein